MSDAGLVELETELKTICATLPHWQQLLIQGFWYGLLSYSITFAEEGRDILASPPTVTEFVQHADTEFVSWPTEWLQPMATEFLQRRLNVQQLNGWFDQLDTIFRDCIPTDLDIFTTLAEGEHLTEHQWERLYDAIALLPPNQEALKKPSHKQKTRRVHGRRAITPMRRRRAMTHHNHHQAPVNLVKLK
jgi:hypothetical protein